MVNVNDIKPWMAQEIERLLASIYFASGFNRSDLSDPKRMSYRMGFVKALASIAIARGLNPESFLSPEDVRLLRKEQA